jgi:hypothetical protein
LKGLEIVDPDPKAFPQIEFNLVNAYFIPCQPGEAVQKSLLCSRVLDERIGQKDEGNKKKEKEGGQDNKGPQLLEAYGLK